MEGQSKFESELSYTKQIPEQNWFVLKRKHDPLGVPLEREYGDENGEVNQDL